jgi:hypothetical protein
VVALLTSVLDHPTLYLPLRCRSDDKASRSSHQGTKTAVRHQPISPVLPSIQRVPNPSVDLGRIRGRPKMLNPQASTFSVPERGLSDPQTYSGKAALHTKKSSGNVKVFIDRDKTKSNQQASTRLRWIRSPQADQLSPGTSAFTHQNPACASPLKTLLIASLATLGVFESVLIHSSAILTALAPPFRSHLSNNLHQVSRMAEWL